VNVITDNPEHSSNGGEPETAPPIVLPLPNIPSLGIANTPESSAGSLVSPQPFVETMEASNPTSLADRVEQTLAEDGRFAALLPQIVITVDDGLAHLSGHIPTAAQKQSLLAAVLAVPGVTGISDALADG